MYWLGHCYASKQSRTEWFSNCHLKEFRLAWNIVYGLMIQRETAISQSPISTLCADNSDKNRFFEKIQVLITFFSKHGHNQGSLKCAHMYNNGFCRWQIWRRRPALSLCQAAWTFCCQYMNIAEYILKWNF